MSLTPAFATPAGVPRAPGAGGGAGAAPGFMSQLNNPLVAAALGVGGGLMASADQGGTLGQGLRSGLGGGLGSYIGAQNIMTQRDEDEERRRQMQELIDRLSDVASRAGGGVMSARPGGAGPGGGIMSATSGGGSTAGVLESYGGLV